MSATNILRAHSLFCEGKYEQAAALFSEGARERDPRALFDLAYCLQYGYGLPADPGRAFDLYLHIKYEEEGDAAYNAGAMLLSGRRVPCDPRAGYELMLVAAEQDCIEAQLYIAMVRLTGCVGEPDIPSICRIPFHKPDTLAALPLLPPTEAVDESLTDRRFEIVDADETEAIHYIRRAAHNRGDYTGSAVGDAEFLLAKCADEGFGREMDHDKAAELYLRAASHGSMAAREKVKTLPAYQVEQARARLRMKKTTSRARLGAGETEPE